VRSLRAKASQKTYETSISGSSVFAGRSVLRYLPRHRSTKPRPDQASGLQRLKRASGPYGLRRVATANR
jgi:hypothetical protein